MNDNFIKILKYILFLFCFMSILSFFYYLNHKMVKNEYQEEILSKFYDYSKQYKLNNVNIYNNGRVEFEKVSGQKSFTTIPDSLEGNIIDMLLKKSINVRYIRGNQKSGLFQMINNFVKEFLFIILIMLIFSYYGRNSGIGNIMKYNTNKATSLSVKTRFSDVAGIDNFRRELEEIVDFLKNGSKYTSVGCNIPKGVLLCGSPGVGKTLLAKAVAGEAQASFFFASGSEFVEMFVGLGASRVRDLFTKARNSKPSIIFIDEIDAIGRKRKNTMHSNQEQESTLNELLNQMDGFGDSTGIIVIGATNLPSVLDDALLRPGRFDRIIQIPKPDIKGRSAILSLVLKRIKVPYNIDIHKIASMTFGFSGADITNLINEALFILVREKKHFLTNQEIEKAFEKIAFGISSHKKYDKLDKLRIARHEVCHAFMTYYYRSILDEEFYKVTILSYGDALGFSSHFANKERVSLTKEQIYATIDMLLAGRCGEELFFGEKKITTGASNDFEKATRYALAMIYKYGMTETNDKFVLLEENFKDLYSDKMKNDSYITAKEILNESYKRVMKIIKKNIKIINKITYFLLQKETLYKHDIEAIINGSFNIGYGSCISIKVKDLSPFDTTVLNIR
ncbi:hypothetical protein AB836_00200 [Rickettsiales bacterium (ex Bugula neritina AB1)]|nr:hypothetical protein AB836_00200 [Rickettsiales bacterium (ex Bugula neritina AB1)]